MPARRHLGSTQATNVAARPDMAADQRAARTAGAGTRMSSLSTVAPDQLQCVVNGTVPGAASTASAGSPSGSAACSPSHKVTNTLL